jgi:hypothetical protein
LDVFGTLVYDRIKDRADAGAKKAGARNGLQGDWKAADVGADAKETCRNWCGRASMQKGAKDRARIIASSGNTGT